MPLSFAGWKLTRIEKAIRIFAENHRAGLALGVAD
jgi:hypothetical protein